MALTGVGTSLRRLFANIRVNERNGDFSPTDELLSIVSMDNPENHPDEESKRCHAKRDEIVF
jgi:hypothetical protein